MAGNFSGDARRSEEEEEYWRSGLVSSAVAITPASHGESQRFTVTRWKHSGTWHKASSRPSPVNLSPKAVKQRGSTVSHRSGVQRTGDDLFYPNRYLQARCTNQDGGGVNLRAERSPTVRI